MRQVVLLRGINIGPRNRVAMPRLRGLLAEAGYENVGTYVQSGNVVLSSRRSPERLAREVPGLIADGFGLARASNTTPVIVLRFEADNETALRRIQNEFRRVFAASAPDVPLPF